MISQTQTSTNQYGFYAVPKKLQPKKKYRQSQYQDFYDNAENAQNEFHQLQKAKVQQHKVERDFYVDEAPYPQFKARPRGLDYGVQIQKGDLFDYDLQVQPLLEILIGRAVVSAINELQQDKQKVEKRGKLQTYQKKRNAQLMVTQRLQAKSTRKKQQSQRRVLQKQTLVKNHKQAGKKVIARQAAKNNLLGLGSIVIDQLEEAGYLRSQAYTDLRINYEGWLYQQVTSLIGEDRKVARQVTKMIQDVKDQKEDEHKGRIVKQNQRRQEILNQRERIRKLNEQRRQKKRIRRQRVELNQQREPNSLKVEEILEKTSELQSVLKFQARSDGWVGNSPGNLVYISGGLGNLVVAMLNSVQDKPQYRPDQIQDILAKLANQTPTSVEFQFSQQHFNLIQQQLQRLHQNPSQYMKNKAGNVSKLKGKVSLSLRLLELAKINIKSHLHDALVQALLNVYLTCTSIPKPETSQPVQEGEQADAVYEATQKDHSRQQLKKKISLTQDKQSSIQQLRTLLRVRFQRKYPSQAPSQHQKSQKPSEQEWIDIYDGQGWAHKCEEFPQQSNREGQKPIAYNLGGLVENGLFVFDERTLYFVRRELERVIEVSSGRELDKYVEGLENLAASLKQKDVAVYDGEARSE